MLTGEELLAKVKEMGGASKSEVVKACGYVSQKKD
ncbi:MAG: AbrB family transcriptional regulator, partial [Synechococcus sp.]